MVIVEGSPERISNKIEQGLRTILHSKVAESAYLLLGFNREALTSLTFEIFKFPVRREIDGVTVFGGTILLSPALFKESELSKCFLKVVFVHEIAHLLRRRTNPECYNAEIATPTHEGSFFGGIPGYGDYLNIEWCTSEGGHQVENALFGAFVTEVDKRQIKYINDPSNWKIDLQIFKSELARKIKSNSLKYNHCRGSNGVFKVDRLLHKSQRKLV
ncbi:unnamed protein product [Blepharisma stoltei]|uniref:Uncharacterized protein n=1 Tax=Blepharisma stoltei TaxID=1481888 RepID=A0AAU9K9X1_9CILI|nr:unnamed protein product [Blepharisma stoltei]